MATATRGRKNRVRNPRGAGSLDEQIERLQEAVGSEGIEQAAQINAKYSPDVVKLAFKTLPSTVELGSRLQNLISRVDASAKEKAHFAKLLMQAKASE